MSITTWFSYDISVSAEGLVKKRESGGRVFVPRVHLREIRFEARVPNEKEEHCECPLFKSPRGFPHLTALMSAAH